MWLFTDTGFISAVTHRDDSNLMMVRARDKKSLEPLAKYSRTEIEKTPTADYPWRTVVSKKQLKTWMAKAIDDAEYDNFKSRVAKTRGHEFVDALHDVWATMHKVEEGHKKKTGKNWWKEHEDLDDEFFDADEADSLAGSDASDFWGINDYLRATGRSNSDRPSRRRRFS